MSYLRLAAAQNNLLALYELGCIYKKGHHRVLCNYTRAMDYFHRAAAQNYVPALNKLGEMFEYGLGVKRNNEEAAKYYSQASSHGSSSARDNLDRMFKNKKITVAYSEKSNSLTPVNHARQLFNEFIELKNSMKGNSGTSFFGVFVSDDCKRLSELKKHLIGIVRRYRNDDNLIEAVKPGGEFRDMIDHHLVQSKSKKPTNTRLEINKLIEYKKEEILDTLAIKTKTGGCKPF